MNKKLREFVSAYTDEPEKIIKCINDFYLSYDKCCMSWLGNLFDPDLGGFYYSNSARDGGEFFPDIESTGQGIAILNVSGAISAYNDIPEWIRSRIAGFICSCEDQSNGYFYNPQWSKEFADKNVLRRARDFGWALSLSQNLDFEMPYFSIFQNAKNNGCATPEFFKSKELFTNYLNSLDWKSRTYESMDAIVNQYDQIFYYGYGECALEFIDSVRDKETGLWGVGYIDKEKQLKTACAALNLYSAMKKPISEPTKLTDFVLGCFNDGMPKILTTICNRFSSIKLIIDNLLKNKPDGYEQTLEKITVTFVSEIPNILPKTAEELGHFKKSNGSFSYFEHFSSSTSYAMPVAQKNAREGDINATLHAVGIWSSLIYIITAGREKIPLFDKSDMLEFEKAATKTKL